MASQELPDIMVLGRGTYLDYVSKNYLTDLTDAIENAPLNSRQQSALTKKSII